MSAYGKLKEILQDMGKVAVAFSGGVDSTFLLAVARDVLGKEAFAITERSALVPTREEAEALSFCSSRGIEQIIVDVDIDCIEGIRFNPKDRCYLCKKELFSEMLKIAREHDAVLVDGSNVDDLSDFRPGARALRELQVRSPLQEAGLRKSEIRELSRELGLPTWDKPSFACLASRFPYGEEITKEGLAQVADAEQMLFDLGLTQLRVRVHGNVARIEVPPDDFAKILEDDARQRIYARFKELGYDYVALDLLGYRTGSLNETIEMSSEQDEVQRTI